MTDKNANNSSDIFIQVAVNVLKLIFICWLLYVLVWSAQQLVMLFGGWQ